MTENGVISKIDKKNIATVRFDRKMACENCNMCFKPKNEMYVEITVDNFLNAKIGDMVAVKMGDNVVLTSSFIVYIIPLIFIGIAIFATARMNAIATALGIIVAIVVSIVAWKVADKILKKKKGLLPEMSSIIYNECSGITKRRIEMLQLDNTNFSKTIEDNQLVLVDFSATWCGPCKMLAPIIESLANDMQDKCLIVKVDIDEALEIAENFGIQSVPTLILFKNGHEVERVMGLRQKPAIAQMIAKHL